MERQTIIPLLARIFLSAIFLWSGINKILNPVGTQDFMAAQGLPFTGILLILAIATEILGGLSVLLGYQVRWGAGILLGFLIPTTLIFHNNLADRMTQIMFLKNLGIMGGLLMIMEYGAGQLVVKFNRK